MDFHVSLAGRRELAAGIYRQLLDAILDGRLRPGERLPPTREMAQRLDVSRNTVAVAYERLTAEGFLVGRVGAGTYVSAERLAKARSRAAPVGSGVQPRDVWRTLPVPAETPSTVEYDFSVGVPDARLFPFETWRRLVAHELRISTVRAAGYGDPAGHAGLRAAIARHVGVARSVRAGADDVLVTHGAQQALDLVGRVLIEPGSTVAVEEPGYWPARLLFRSLGARVVGVPVDGEGLDVAAIPAAARLVYVTPSHQFPLGTPLSLARRAALLAWAERRNGVVIEDDYDSEFRFEDRPLEPLQSLDRSGRVVYVGSFSKTLLPMLRLGFLVAPASLRPALRTAKRLTDWHGDQPTQGALARFIDEGLLARHVRKATRQYAARHGRIVAALRDDFGDWLRVVPSAAGLHLCALAAPGVPSDMDAVVARASAAGVAVQSLAAYHGDPPGRPGLVIGYGAIPYDRIGAGLRRLAASFG
ncbi:MocR-like pyridoxine biosynthesis transcription factor PdxR [Phytohabitans rumicis]|uniref:GntR family transcriptional regulator n=1 Tax=Phytohabitans rumicis TaxID=1076125 RepID=A0A6V8LCV0_9ACTN|nr:PLP-dependent aminotransferase family protein [Phytohabitans rumicis]GFJ91906.1 GntR family transcriptional regulator [Phytohabitans rumicis]